MPYAAYLRAYEPLAAYPEPDRSMWASSTAGDDRPSRAENLDGEHEQALRNLVAVPPIVAPERETMRAYLRRVDGITYVCPWQTRLRSWLALVELRESLPEKVADAFIPRAVADQVTADFERWRSRHMAERPHILTSTWHVPLAWFVPFDPAERWLVLGDRGTAGPDTSGATTAAPTRALVYVTPMVQARRRIARALAVIRRNLGDSVELTGVEDVGRWLEEFHPRSLVELDYGGLVHLLDDDSLRADQSVADVATALTGLETGKTDVAGTMYERLTTRWWGVRSLESAN